MGSIRPSWQVRRRNVLLALGPLLLAATLASDAAGPVPELVVPNRDLVAQSAVRCMPRSAVVNTATNPTSASNPGHVSPQVTGPTNPWRAASTIWVAGL